MKTQQTSSLTTIVLGLMVLLLAASPAVGKDLRDWGVKIDKASSRFKVLKAFNNEAVLDKETQLVWARKSSTFRTFWGDAREQCTRITIGDRMGWRLPSIHELLSLMNLTQDGLALPTSHPFQNIQENSYWTATTNAENTNLAWIARLSDGTVSFDAKEIPDKFFLCVRGGSPGPDAY